MKHLSPDEWLSVSAIHDTAAEMAEELAALDAHRFDKPIQHLRLTQVSLLSRMAAAGIRSLRPEEIPPAENDEPPF